MRFYSRHPLLSTAFSFVFFMLFFTIIPFQVAQAVTINNGGIPVGRQGHLDSQKRLCKYSSSSPTTYDRALISWISESTDTSSEPAVFTVAEGQNSLILKYNMLGHNCTQNMVPADLSGAIQDKNTLISRSNFVNAAAQSGSQNFTISGLSGQYNDIDWTNSYGSPEYFYVKLSPTGSPVNRNFTISGLSSLSAGTHTVTVTITTRWVNQYVPGSSQPTGAQYVCVNPADSSRPSSNGLTGTVCNTSVISVPINIKVEPDSPTANINVNCSRVRVTATSPSKSNLDVRLIVDGEDQNIGFISNMASGSTQDIDISRWKDVAGHSFTVRVFDRSTGLRFTPTAQSTGNCITVQCGSVSLSPSTPQPGEKFSITMSMNISNYGDLGDPFHYRMIFRIEDQNGTDMLSAPNPRTTTISQSSPGSTSVTSTYDNLSLTTAGRYNVIYRMQYGKTSTLGLLFPISSNDGCDNDSQLDIFYKPYVRFFGNDVFAGGAFADTNGQCPNGPLKPDAGIAVLEDLLPPPANYRVASSVEFAAFALGSIKDQNFQSAGRRQNGALPTTVASGLVFGNFDGGAKQSIGEFGGGWRCVTEFNDMPPGATTISGGSFGTRNFATGTDNVFYANGDLTLNGNVTLADYTSVKNIPTLYVYVDGDLNINPTVSRVDGVYIVKGTVYTCANPSGGGAMSENSVYDLCQLSNLRVNGAIIASKFVFQRASGTLSKAVRNEAITTNISETFSFLPEIYLSQPAGREIGEDADIRYDYITSLPPIL